MSTSMNNTSKSKFSEHEIKTVSGVLRRLEEKFGQETYSRLLTITDIMDMLNGLRITTSLRKFIMDNCRVARGTYDLSVILKTLVDSQNVLQKEVPIETEYKVVSKPETKPETIQETPVVAKVQSHKDNSAVVEFMYRRQVEFNRTNYIPKRDEDFVPFGFHNSLKTIIESKKFFPCYITGPSGLGKNMTVSQVCNSLHHPMVLVSITEETSDDDLIGCWTLQNGDTIWKEGPVVFAARHGMIVVLDEIDLATPKIMCLQSILNGDPIYIEATGELLIPKEGFNIIATGNTKGFGESSIHIGTQALNEAFLERFKIMFDHGFPTAAILKKIVKKKMDHLGLTDAKDQEFGANLVQFVDYVASAFKSESIDYFVSNRRLSAIIETYGIFKDVVKSLTLGLSRFPKPIVQTFLSLYTKIDSSLDLTPDEIFEQMKKELETFE